MSVPLLRLDFESFSEANLKQVGAHAYAAHPSTKVLCMAWAFDDGPVHVWTPFLASTGLSPGVHIDIPTGRDITICEGFPQLVIDHVDCGRPVAGWNVTFEYLIWNRVLPRTVHGLPSLRAPTLRDTMAQAAYHGLPLSLDEAAGALPLGIAKDREGHALMLRMSRPRTLRPTVTWWHEVTSGTHAGKLPRLMFYCAQDVRVERTIGEFLPPLPDREQQIWQMDLRANLRGIALDIELAGQMMRVAKAEVARLDEVVRTATDGLVNSTRQVAALTDWLEDRGHLVHSLAKDQLDDLTTEVADRGDMRALDALLARQEAAKTSVLKAPTMLAWAGKDARMRGLTQYYGAFRTGRWAGRGPQVQNYPRPTRDAATVEAIIAHVRACKDVPPEALGGMLEAFDVFWGLTPLDALKEALRGCLRAGSGRMFASVDFSQIEARVLAWLAGEYWMLEAFRNGEDLYVRQAADIFGTREDSVDAHQRQVGKVAVLALGYQGGTGAFETMAKNYDLDLTGVDPQGVVDAYRQANPRIKAFWYACEQAALVAMKNPKQVVQVVVRPVYPGSTPTVQFARWRNHLLCKLPSGRTLWYRDAKLDVGRFGNEAISYMGVDQYTRQWTRILTYGGKFVEQVTQATARDLLADAMLRVDDLAHIDLLGSVHDEVLAEVGDRLDYDVMLQVMLQVPAWATGLPLDADGYIGERFAK